MVRRIINNPKYAAPLSAASLNLLVGIVACIVYHVKTGQAFAPSPKCAAVYLYTSISAISIGVVGITKHDAIPGDRPLEKTLFLAGVSWAVFVAATFLPKSGSLARRGLPQTVLYYGIAALASMSVLVYVRERLTASSN